MPKSKKQKEAGALSLEQQRFNIQAQREELKLRREAFQTVEPFAKMLLTLGLDPLSILSSPIGISLLLPGRTAIADEFEAARQRLVDFTGSRGLSTQSGVAVGPFANLFGQEAQAQSELVAGLPLQALNLGLQGGNLLTGAGAQLIRPDISGQIAVSAGQNVIQQPAGPGLDVAVAALGGAGTALGGLLQNPNLFKA